VSGNVPENVLSLILTIFHQAYCITRSRPAAVEDKFFVNTKEETESNRVLDGRREQSDCFHRDCNSSSSRFSLYPSIVHRASLQNARGFNGSSTNVVYLFRKIYVSLHLHQSKFLAFKPLTSNGFLNGQSRLRKSIDSSFWSSCLLDRLGAPYDVEVPWLALLAFWLLSLSQRTLQYHGEGFYLSHHY
jgi:hypothetical protein